MKRFYPFLLMFLLTRCTTDPVITSHENVGFYYVRCTLNPDRTVQQLVLCKTVPEELPLDIPDAKVTLSTDSQTIPFQYIQKYVYQDADSDLVLKPGETYRLDIRLKDGAHITGETTLPGPFSILSPNPNDTLLYSMTEISCYENQSCWRKYAADQDSIRWTPSFHTKYFMVFMGFVRQPNWDRAPYQVMDYFQTTQNAERLPLLSNSETYQGFPDSVSNIQAIITVIAHDFTSRSFSEIEYLYHGEEYDETKSKLWGAQGLFNGFWQERQPVVLKIITPPSLDQSN